ncbi:hypothetical protein D9M70_340460 [compost metagenome]
MRQRRSPYKVCQELNLWGGIHSLRAAQLPSILQGPTYASAACTCSTVGCAMRTECGISPRAALNRWCARRTLPGRLRRSI